MSEPKIPGGCILLARRIIESEIWDKPPLYLKVWVYLLTLAQHSDYKKMQRGQLRTSIPDIIEACSWRIGARKERPTKDQIYQVIQWLRKPNEGVHESNAKATMITTTKATQGLLVTIDNYGFYQDFVNYESNDDGNDEKATKTVRKQREPNNINKNVKNDKNEQEKEGDISINNYTPEFELFWQSYPRQIEKVAAYKTWQGLIKKKVDPELIIRCAMNYRNYTEANSTLPEFIKHPTTFLNKERYAEYANPIVLQGGANDPIGRIIKLYEKKIGSCAPSDKDSLKLYCENFTVDWVEHAIDFAYRVNKRTKFDVFSILKEWQRSGQAEPWVYEDVMP